MKLFTVEEVRGFDQTAINDWGIPAETLMARAGEAAWQQARSLWPECRSIRVFCGGGNNGGDGWVVARHALEAGLHCQVFAEAGREAATPASQHARAAYLAAGGVVEVSLPAAVAAPDTLVIDALLGIGLSRAPAGWTRDAINAVNEGAGPVLALDCPSGLDADCGHAPGAVVAASHTVTFIAPKRGLYTGQARDFTGGITLASLALPSADMAAGDAACELLALAPLMATLPPRQATAHKGRAGHLLVIGGDHGMGGAALMAAEAALRAGAGLVSLATRQEHVSAALNRCPEIMATGVDDPADLAPMLERASAVVLGPGLGTGLWGRDLMSQLSTMQHPIVLDADALNLVARGGVSLTEQTIITPHPGEAGRLLDSDAASIEQDRFAAVSMLAERYRVTAVLKGAGTLISDWDAQLPVGVCSLGNAGMASGGMGDVLSGVLGSLLAQGMGTPQAARLGVMLHSAAADLAAEGQGMRGLVATDLMQPIRALLNGRGLSGQN